MTSLLNDTYFSKEAELDHKYLSPFKFRLPLIFAHLSNGPAFIIELSPFAEETIGY